MLWPGDPIEYTGGVGRPDPAPFDPCGRRLATPFGVRPVGERINPKEIPIERRDFDDDVHGFDDGFDDLEGLIDGLFKGRPDKAARDKWGIEGLDIGGFGLEDFMDEWGIGGGGLFDGVGGGLGLFGDDRGGITSGIELVSDAEGGLGKGDPLVGDPWSPENSTDNPLGFSSPIRITEGSVTEGNGMKPYDDKGITIGIKFDSGATPVPAPGPEVPRQRQPEVY